MRLNISVIFECLFTNLTKKLAINYLMFDIFIWPIFMGTWSVPVQIRIGWEGFEANYAFKLFFKWLFFFFNINKFFLHLKSLNILLLKSTFWWDNRLFKNILLHIEIRKCHVPRWLKRFWELIQLGRMRLHYIEPVLYHLWAHLRFFISKEV